MTEQLPWYAANLLKGALWNIREKFEKIGNIRARKALHLQKWSHNQAKIMKNVKKILASITQKKCDPKVLELLV